jgi:2-octaprenyl-6-methoxyphenol hydroxylase
MTIGTFDVAVVGAGPAGLIAGLAMAQTDFGTAVIGPTADPLDGRTSALFQGSIELLKSIGAWDAIMPFAEPLDAMRLVDATDALFRAPEVTFHAREIGETAFGYNVPNAVLTASLEKLAASRLQRIVTAAVTDLSISSDHVSLTTHDGETYTATLIAAADGRNSPSREAADITTKRWSYDQAAIVCSFAHSRNHKRISTEFHRRVGPLTVVPAPGGLTSNLVWVDSLAEGERITALTEPEFIHELEHHLGGLLGSICPLSPRRMFPLSGQTAEPMAQNRIALIGEAGHVIPPIGAQGLNLSFRDAATLADIAADARDRGEDIGGASALSQYSAARQTDVTSRVWTIDLLNRSLLSTFAPVHMLRGLGLFALSTIGPLRKRIMREGIAPTQSTPRLMQRAG